MEVLDFQIEGLAPTVPDAARPPSSTVTKSADAEALEEENLKDVDLSDIVHFKRVVRRPPLRVNVLPGGSKDVNSASQRVSSPTPAVEAQTIAQATSSDGSARNPEVEIFKSFRVGIDDPTWKILPAALKKYNINAPWENYALYIVYGDQERCLELDEKPLVLFKRLNKEGKKPVFVLRKITEPQHMNNLGDCEGYSFPDDEDNFANDEYSRVADDSMYTKPRSGRAV
jgi:hypothetical protein